jgi:hypothetical protein
MLSVSLAAPDSIASGGRVTFRLLVRNTSGRAVDLYLRGRKPTLDVVVEREDGRVVWRGLEGRVIPAVLQVESLAPGQTLEVSAVWDLQSTEPPVEQGTYVVRASLLADDAAIAATPGRFTITR